jgi:hypothetical protein
MDSQHFLLEQLVSICLFQLVEVISLELGIPY